MRALLETHENESARAEARLLIAEKPERHECELRYVEGKVVADGAAG